MFGKLLHENTAAVKRKAVDSVVDLELSMVSSLKNEILDSDSDSEVLYSGPAQV